MVCIWEMLYDLRDWAKPTAMLTIAFGLVMHILAPEYRLDGSPGAFRPIPDLDWDFSPGGPFFMTFWALLGFYEPGELAVAPGTALIAPTMFWVYLFISLVLLINLLIAMFSKSYGAVMERSDENWKMSRVVLVRRAWDGGHGWGQQNRTSPLLSVAGKNIHTGAPVPAAPQPHHSASRVLVRAGKPPPGMPLPKAPAILEQGGRRAYRFAGRRQRRACASWASWSAASAHEGDLSEDGGVGTQGQARPLRQVHLPL